MRAHDVSDLVYVGWKMLDFLSEQGLEVSDVPRLWLDAMARWARGEAPPHEITPYTKALYRLGETLPRDPVEATPAELAMQQMVYLCVTVRAARRRWYTNGLIDLDGLIEPCVVLLCTIGNEPASSARARAWQWYRDAQNRG